MRPERAWRRPRLVALAIAAALCSAVSCPQVFVDTPREAQIVDDAAVDVAGRVATALVESTAEIRLDGVDLIGALGLSPPFADAGGTVVIGSQTVLVSDFDYSNVASSDTFRFRVAGLDPSSHGIEVVGLDINAKAYAVKRLFAVTTPLVLALDALDAGAAPPRVLPGGLAYATSLAPPWSAGRIHFADGSSIGTAVPGAAAALTDGAP